MSDAPATASNDWTIGKLLAWTKAHFESCGIADARLCAELLLAKALGCRRIELYTRIDEVPADGPRSAFREMVRAAAQRRPIAHLVGTKEFYALEFAVSPDVLIPRPETELLVERAIDWCRRRPADRHDVLDIGTGSGCVAVAIAKRVATAHVVATDVSAKALEVARGNVSRHGVEARVRLVEADMLKLPEGAVPAGGFHVIVSNPPYIAEDDRAQVEESVARYEPAVALFAADGGLAAYRALAAGAAELLREDGALVVEVGAQQADQVAELLCSTGRLELAARYRDLAGIERALEFVPKSK